MKKIIFLILLMSCIMMCVLFLDACGNAKKADRVIYGNIYTSNDNAKTAEALAIKGDKFIYVGSKDGVKKYIGKDTIVETFGEEQLITASLVDGHTHVSQLMITRMDSLGQISQGANREVAVKDITDYVNNNPDLKFYTLSGWEMQNFASEEYGCPTAEMLEGITNRPILAISSDGHSYWVNNVLIKLAGVTRDSVAPDGGIIVCDNDGEPLGVFKDTAQYAIDGVRPDKPHEVYEQGIIAADRMCLSEGYVYRFQALDNLASNPWKYPIITTMEEMDKAGKLITYTQGSFTINNTDDALELVDEAIKVRNETAGGNYEVTAVKIFLDGIIENAGAYLSEEYNGRPGYYGTQRWEGDDAIVKMGHIIAKANAAGMPVHFHGMGDQAISDILTAIEYATDEVGIDCVRKSRNAIAHLCLLKDSDFERFAKLNVIAVFNPWCNKDPGYYDLQVSLLGQKRASSQYPMQSFLKAGVNYAFGTDLGASFTYKSIECLHALTTRTYNNDDPGSLLNAKEKLSREETLKAMTIGGAYQLKKEDVFGSIEMGKDASLCVFSKDLLTIPDTEIMSTEVLKCMYKGNWCEME